MCAYSIGENFCYDRHFIQIFSVVILKDIPCSCKTVYNGPAHRFFSPHAFPQVILILIFKLSHIVKEVRSICGLPKADRFERALCYSGASKRVFLSCLQDDISIFFCPDVS